MEERAFLEYQDKVPMPSPEAFLKAYGRAQELYASNGITTVQEGMLPAKLLPLYRMLEGSGLLKLDLVAYVDDPGKRCSGRGHEGLCEMLQETI
mgnify:CR=1 FL=1